MRQAKKPVPSITLETAGSPQQKLNDPHVWTLVDFLFPAEHAPIWRGSANDVDRATLAKTA